MTRDQEIALLGFELSHRCQTHPVSRRKYTAAERAVILSTFVPVELALLALMLVPAGLGFTVPGLERESVKYSATSGVILRAAAERLDRDPLEVSHLAPRDAAYVFADRMLELQP